MVQKSRKFGRFAWIIIPSLIIIVLIFLYPGFLYLNDSFKVKVVLGCQLLDVPVILEKEEILFPVVFVQEYLDPSLFWDKEEEMLTVTTDEKVLQMRTDQLTAYLNRKPLELNFPVVLMDGKPYLPMKFLQDFFRIELFYDQETNTIVIDKEDIPYLEAAVIKNVYLRSAPTICKPRIIQLEAGQAVRVYKEDNGWYYLRTASGLLGYAPKKALQMRKIMVGGDISLKKKYAPWHPWGEKISLVWEHVIQENPVVEKIGPMYGVNVVSPTWFCLRDEEGNLQNLADFNYIRWAKEQGYQVWALVSNNFDRERTSSVLRSSEKREKVIDQLLAFSSLYELDGINVDFENLYLGDGEYLTQFMRELAPMAREQGLILSIDVTFPGGSKNWSLIYDRRALGEIADYVIVMAYDEHWGTSPVAGSVASLPWVERGLRNTLNEVPAEKLLLGVPFYTRLWEIEYLEGGGEKVRSSAYGMERILDILNSEDAKIVYDETTGQNYASYEKAGHTYKVWLEDLLSLESRIKLTEKYHLAGIAAWRRGLENQAVWELFSKKFFIE